MRRKTKFYLIGEKEAELEVVVDTLIAQQGGRDQALLFVIKEICDYQGTDLSNSCKNKNYIYLLNCNF